MKILAIGDFHGKFPEKLKKIIKKEKIDLVVSVGDYPTFSLKKEFFKYVYGKPELDLWDFIGRKEYKRKSLVDLKNAERVIMKLNDLSIPVISLLGNHDWPYANDVTDLRKPKGKRFWAWDWEKKFALRDFIEKQKNITLLNYSYCKFGDFVFIGMRGHSYPGKVKSRAFRRHKLALEKMFNKFRKENKNRKVIFLAHICPYKTRLDLITAKDAHKKARGKHYGSKLARRIIDKFQPVLFIGGHFEEAMGIQKLGKTLCVNNGSIHHGKGVIVDIQGKNIKVKLIK